MKKLFVRSIVLSVFLTGSVNASQDFCSAQHELAEQTMSFRQSGGSRSTLDAVVYSEQGQAIADMAWARGIVPQEAKRTAIKGFAEYVESICRKSMNKEVDGIRT